MDLYTFVSITFIWIYVYYKIVWLMVIYLYIVSVVSNMYNIHLYITGLKMKNIRLYWVWLYFMNYFMSIIKSWLDITYNQMVIFENSIYPGTIFSLLSSIQSSSWYTKYAVRKYIVQTIFWCIISLNPD